MPQIIVPIMIVLLWLLSLAAIVVIAFRALQDAGVYKSFYENLGFLGTLLSLPLTIAILFMLAWLALAAMIFVGPLWLVVVFLGVDWFRKYRTSRQYGLLWLLTVSAERDMPLGAALAAFAEERNDSFGRRAKRLAKLLDEGVSLPDGLDRLPGLLPPHAPPMVRVGCQSGALAPALRRAAESSDFNSPLWMSLTGKFAYVLLLALSGLSLVVYMLVWIVPKF
ncbi:MAG: type II secretion system F family protein, partial [Pirellulales bacterium]|nr:type II secretion system F family protein [Pirellulales bacterium]